MSTQKKRSIHVMAAVITDARGRILLARRDGTSDLQGLWEFPGGKREPGEACEDALVRELQEELDITVEVGEALIQVPQHYPGKYLRLDVRHVRAWQGKPKGHEGQALTWVNPDKLPRYSMPPADLPVVAALLQPDRCLRLELGRGEAALAAAREAIDAGATRFVLSSASGFAGDLALVRALIALPGKAQWLLEGDLQAAQALGIGAMLLPSQLAGLQQRPLGEGQLLAARCDDVEQARAAQALGCDFIELAVRAGAANGTLDWDAFEGVREEVALPIYAGDAAGCIDLARARAHGAQGVSRPL